MALPAAIDFAKNASASPDRMDQAMVHLDGRLRALEVQRKTFDDALLQIQTVGLQRVNDALQPYYRALEAIVSLGVLFNAGSTTAVPIATGAATFTLSEADRDRFAYAGFMIAVSKADSRNALVGRTVSYDRATGLFVLDVIIASGDVAVRPADWEIMPVVPPFVPAAVIDPGSDVQNGLSAVPYLPIPTQPGTVTEFDPGTA